MSVEVYIGAGCRAKLTWPRMGRVEIVVRGPGGDVKRRIGGTWSRAAVLRADTQVRNIAAMAVGTGLAPALIPDPPAATAALPKESHDHPRK